MAIQMPLACSVYITIAMFLVCKW